MLYQELVTRKVIRTLEFRGIKTQQRIQELAPELIRQYLVPLYLRRDVYFGVLIYVFPRYRLDYLEVLINEAYPQKEVYSEEAKKFIKEKEVN